VQIEVWSDFACPWCALGIYRLDRALAEFEHGDEITVRHRSFELDPRAPAKRSQTMEEIVAAKYGRSPEQVAAGHEQMAAMGAEVGMEFHFDRVQLGNTFDAHRVAQAARGTPVEDAVVKGLFGAYFTEGSLLSDHQTLQQTATAAGLDPDLVRDVLAGDAHTDDVRADEAAARELGITGVPHFVINGAWAVPGAQDVDTLVTVLRRAWERTEA
jgi:predicted DsbA family dithiol-disulfide isomerase